MDRFIEGYSQGGFVKTGVKVLIDRQTGVNYLFCQNGYAGGLTPLLNRDGRPVVTSLPREENE